MEIWKDIEGYEGMYQISNLGRVKSLKMKKEHNEYLLKPFKSKNGYLRVSLSKSNKFKQPLIHRLVAIHFLDNPNNYPEVNHKDENKLNNCVDNLEWCDRKYNVLYGTAKQRESKTKHKYYIGQYDLNQNLIMKWNSLKEIEINTNYKKNNIQQNCLGNTKTAYGYKWKYIPI